MPVSAREEWVGPQFRTLHEQPNLPCNAPHDKIAAVDVRCVDADCSEGACRLPEAPSSPTLEFDRQLHDRLVPVSDDAGCLSRSLERS
jgi:hypothetical protein